MGRPRLAEAYPRTPPGWTVVARRTAGPFTTHVTYRKPDGSSAHWSSRYRRKHSSRLRGTSWWIGVLFAIGSACFLVGPFPGFVQLVGAEADGMVFFVGSIFFTSAALLQYLEAANATEQGAPRRRLRLLTFEPRRIDWWITGSQLIGTVFFNINTYRALQSAIDDSAVDRLIWRPDAIGSALFLLSGVLAFYEIRAGGLRIGQRSREWRIATVNLLGCILFAVSAVASYVVPDTGSVADLAAANVSTALGALCFLIGSLLLLPEARAESPDRDDASMTTIVSDSVG
jgi:hypothetical protein